MPQRKSRRLAERGLDVHVDRPRALLVRAAGDGGLHRVPEPLVEVFPHGLRAGDERGWGSYPTRAYAWARRRRELLVPLVISLVSSSSMVLRCKATQVR